MRFNGKINWYKLRLILYRLRWNNAINWEIQINFWTSQTAISTMNYSIIYTWFWLKSLYWMSAFITLAIAFLLLCVGELFITFGIQINTLWSFSSQSMLLSVNTHSAFVSFVRFCFFVQCHHVRVYHSHLA